MESSRDTGIYFWSSRELSEVDIVWTVCRKTHHPGLPGVGVGVFMYGFLSDKKPVESQAEQAAGHPGTGLGPKRDLG